MPGNHYPHLSLNNVSLDQELARRLPRGLAYYYLAMPLGRDGDRLSLVMAHPDDRKAIAVLGSVLGVRIVPVQGAASEIRAALDRLWSDDTPPSVPRILLWGASPEESGSVSPLVGLIARVLSAQITYLDASVSNLETALTIAREGGYVLTVIDVPEGSSLPHVVCETSTPLLLVHGGCLALEHILLVLRGHAPDESTLDWIIPLARATQATVTLLALAPEPLPFHTRESRMFQGLALLLFPDSGLGEHVFTCARRLNEAGVQGYLKLRQGHSERQIADEMAEGSYDLIAIAAEAHGDFVQQVLSEVEGRAPHSNRPVLVIKPTIP
jgi:hypothetical protein